MQKVLHNINILILCVFLQNPTDIVSVNEALLVRFHSDDTIVSKGFSASYVAVEPINSEEMAYKRQEEEEDEDNIDLDF